MPNSSDTRRPATRRPTLLVGVGSLVLVGSALPLVGVLTGQDGHWLWLLLLSARRAAATAVATSALAVVVVGLAWWVGERRHAARAQGSTAWLAGVGPSTSTWVPRWVTLGGLGFVAVGFALVFASGGDQSADPAPWGAPEPVAPLVSLVKLIGGVLMLAAPGTVLAGGSWWLSRYRHRAVTRPDGTETDVRPGALSSTGPARHPVRLAAGGAVVGGLGAVVVVVTNVVGGALDFPGAQGTTPEDGLLRCCTFVAEGTTLTTWFLVGVLLLWAGLTAVAVAVSWWDVERQAGRPDTPDWVAGLAPDPSQALARDFPPTGAPPEPSTGPAQERDAAPAPRRPTRAAPWLTAVGLGAVVAGGLLTASLSTARVGTTVYVYDAGPALLGLVFLLPVGLALAVSGGLWWFARRAGASVAPD